MTNSSVDRFVEAPGSLRCRSAKMSFVEAARNELGHLGQRRNRHRRGDGSSHVRRMRLIGFDDQERCRLKIYKHLHRFARRGVGRTAHMHQCGARLVRGASEWREFIETHTSRQSPSVRENRQPRQRRGGGRPRENHLQSAIGGLQHSENSHTGNHVGDLRRQRTQHNVESSQSVAFVETTNNGLGNNKVLNRERHANLADRGAQVATSSQCDCRHHPSGNHDGAPKSDGGRRLPRRLHLTRNRRWLGSGHRRQQP